MYTSKYTRYIVFMLEKVETIQDRTVQHELIFDSTISTPDDRWAEGIAIFYVSPLENSSDLLV